MIGPYPDASSPRQIYIVSYVIYSYRLFDVNVSQVTGPNGLDGVGRPLLLAWPMQWLRPLWLKEPALTP